MSTITAPVRVKPLAPAPRRPAEAWPGPRLLAAWYAAFAAYAAAVAIFSGPGDDRSWGIWAAAGYGAAAAIASLWRGAGRHAALLASLAGGLVAPLAWLAITAPPTPDVQVVSWSAALLLRHGTPYLSSAHLAGWLAYNPYLPVMSVFGLPRAIGVPGVAGDPRVWLAAVSVPLFVLVFRVAGRRDALRWGLFAVASPVVAFPLALGITDPPVLALVCLALAVLSRASGTRPAWPAAIIIGVACAMKYTAWPALPVLMALVMARDGIRAAARFAAAAVGMAAALAVAFAPAALGKPAALLQNTVLFPLGLTRAKTPAASPLPGHLLAMTGTAGHLAAVSLLITAGLAVVISLAARPPADDRAAARRLAIELALVFALAPASRFGYFAYPAGLLGWLALSGHHGRPTPDAGHLERPDRGVQAKLINAAIMLLARVSAWMSAWRLPYTRTPNPAIRNSWPEATAVTRPQASRASRTPARDRTRAGRVGGPGRRRSSPHRSDRNARASPERL